jgi:hypothetical protein
MNKSLFLLYLGLTIGMLVAYFVQPIELRHVITYGVMMVIFSHKRITDVVMFLFLVTFCIIYPLTFVLTGIKWYEPILLVYVMFGLFYNTFKKVDKPIFVNEGDISLFPVVFKWKGMTVDTRHGNNGLIIGEYGDGTFDVLFDNSIVRVIDVSEIYKVY